MKRQTREQARQLRLQGISVRDIAKTLSVSRGSVSLWVRDIELSDAQVAALKDQQRQWGAGNAGGQANYRIFREKRIAYQEAGRAKAREGSHLHLIGCMLYWAEGAKVKRNSVHFVNSDPNMLLLFIEFLREEMRVRDEDFRLQIHCHTHDEAEIERIEHYWTSLLHLPDACLQKTQVKKGGDSRKNRLENGVCALQVHNTELVQHIYGAIQEYGGFDNPDWLF
jgi:hypothetical protein